MKQITLDTWSVDNNVPLTLEARGELYKIIVDYKKDLLQVVIEDVPHQYQSRLIESLT